MGTESFLTPNLDKYFSIFFCAPKNFSLQDQFGSIKSISTVSKFFAHKKICYKKSFESKYSFNRINNLVFIIVRNLIFYSLYNFYYSIRVAISFLQFSAKLSYNIRSIIFIYKFIHSHNNLVSDITVIVISQPYH